MTPTTTAQILIKLGHRLAQWRAKSPDLQDVLGLVLGLVDLIDLNELRENYETYTRTFGSETWYGRCLKALIVCRTNPGKRDLKDAEVVMKAEAAAADFAGQSSMPSAAAPSEELSPLGDAKLEDLAHRFAKRGLTPQLEYQQMIEGANEDLQSEITALSAEQFEAVMRRAVALVPRGFAERRPSVLRQLLAQRPTDL